MNTIITLGRQLGSNGRVIGRELAEKLGYKFYDKEIIARIAKENGLSEAVFSEMDEKPTTSLLYSLVMGVQSTKGLYYQYNDFLNGDNLFKLQVDLIRKIFPDAGITTDIIVGFPTETEEDFETTLKFVDRVAFSDIHPFPFSPRSGTVAYKMKDLSGNIKKARLHKMLEKKAQRKLSFARSMQGKILSFLPEEEKDGFIEGYAENYLRLYVKDCALDKKIVKVKVGEPFKDGALAEII